jgi:hypothetical protein
MRVRNMLAFAAIGTLIGFSLSQIRRWWVSWGIDPEEGIRALPGDEVVPDPVASETRGITIEAPPEQVWPWLVQMGFGRAGWYSYDRLDQRGKSADGIVATWQTLKQGDIIPTHPGGGFEVVALEPGRSLVLRSDTALVMAQAAAAELAKEAVPATTAVVGDEPPVQPATKPMPAGLAASGAILGATPQQFSASWSFVLEPIGGGRTRLIERFRVWYGESGFGSHVIMPAVGFGVFVMLQKQMVGIKARAERLARERAGSAAAPFPDAGATRGGPMAPVQNGRNKHAEGPELVTSTVG